MRGIRGVGGVGGGVWSEAGSMAAKGWAAGALGRKGDVLKNR